MPEKILVIEDSRSFAQLLKHLIESAYGFTVDIADSLHAAVDLISNNGQEYFVSIVDLHLPDAPEGEAVDLVSAHQIPAVVLTGTTKAHIEEDLWAKGIADYFHKSGKHSLEYVVWAVNRLYLNNTVKVLVVDDSSVARAAMERLLKIQRYQVFCASGGEEALEIIEREPDIHLAIIDCFMKGMDGFELAAQIRESHSKDDLAIIGVSSQGGQSVSAQFIKSGADDFLLKPFLPEEFFCRVNHSAAAIESYHNLKQLNAENKRLLGTAAHDIRGPLGVIYKSAQLALRPDQKPESRDNLLQMIERSSNDLLVLLDNLLDVSAIESGHLNIDLGMHDLSDIVQDRISLYRMAAEAKGIHLDLKSHHAHKVNVDKTKIKQVIDNLITNAIKYSPEGGNVEINIVDDKSGVTCSIEDSGPGIKETEREKLFIPFSTLSTTPTAGEKSVGLGLAISKRIIDAHQGHIGYRDNPKGGSCFYLQLPGG